MCGIAGILDMKGRPTSLEELRGMYAALFHRGPDEEGFYLGKGAALGMRRLRIIDLETGNQPVRNEEGSIWVVLMVRFITSSICAVSWRGGGIRSIRQLTRKSSSICTKNLARVASRNYAACSPLPCGTSLVNSC